ncbi:hypothetical protein [Dactylosporangium matsuzakiense]|uniref:Uncharacterized protein n=1 Tax=Dactylosporangium matsuzakiense TaxID=53360 RepID=A0A9W6KS90_9ACTN|nr:hypothetical protein [Dactylosporangium matsuzakiense]UWZ48458.1 hypothetical protein Dmats_19830 [Dactylosporangium matsuzakiense]GLL06277.1 hypothetical protein GCM10017581_080260 [Dactylosporangium matsuzakiense]
MAARYARNHREQHIAGPSPDRVPAVAAIGRLPDGQRLVIVLHYLADKSVLTHRFAAGVAVRAAGPGPAALPFDNVRRSARA